MHSDIIQFWKDCTGTPSVRKAKLVEYITELGFKTKPALEGTYKKVYISTKHNFVVKISKKGIGNPLPRNPKINDLILQPYYTDKHVMLQPKAKISSSDSMSAFLSLSAIIKERNMEEFFNQRDFSENNCAMYKNKPYIIDISFYPGYTTVNS